MKRRAFLKLTAMASATIFLNLAGLSQSASMSQQVQSDDILYMGNSNGEILFSRDSGETWLDHTRLPAGTSIMSINIDPSGRVYAHLGYSGHSFTIKLAEDGRNWMTV